MKTNITRNWWVLLVNGLLAILFGGLSLFATEALMLSISMYFGLLILIGGILLLFGAWDKQRKQRGYSMMLTEGIISIVLGILIMIFPGQTLKLFFIFIGIWALLLGLFKIYVGILLKGMDSYRNIFILGGIVLFVIGLVMLLDPAYIAGLILQVIGVIFVIIGMMLVYFSFIVKGAGKDTES
ncbi:MAG: DUF308 domain-containing protein [Bacteroidales bacterium]|jgi:uncharacterized membrane protein HdeD (DUF308 family)|nr:DUF308 domain-containing protein [Bacteroidales bacterium]